MCIDCIDGLLLLNPTRPCGIIECINCGVCHASCDVVAWNDEYLGPAALNRAWSLVNDDRHEARDETLEAALGPGGCSNCHSHGNCMTACPIGLSPTRSIAGLKKLNAAGFGVEGSGEYTE